MAHGPDTHIALQRVKEWIKKGDSSASLNLSYLNITSLPPLPNSLQYLHCNGTQISYLPPLPDSLQFLNCSYTQISSLPPLPNSLQYLFCSNIQITSLPSLPNSLQHLFCSNTQITSLPPLPDTLRQLNCPYTQITSLPPLPDSLQYLYFYNCPNLLLKKEKDESVQNYEARWKVVREALRREEAIQRCKAVKEELMTKTWHPDRYLQWCIDEEERSFWNQESCSNAA